MLTRSSFLTALATLFVLQLCASAEDKPNDTAIEQLQGRWEIVAGVSQGREMSEAEVDGTYVTITTNKITTYDRDERQRYRAIFRIDESKKPMHITMTAVEKNAPTNKLKLADRITNAVSSGVLRFDGQGKWQLCYALPGFDRPEKFESPVGSKNMLFR
ncbi:MAG: TIGR03067 domain-containing protein, partial [Pirellulaceae bacterium]